MIPWLIAAGIVVVATGYLLGVVGHRREAGETGTVEGPPASTEPSVLGRDPPSTRLQEAGAILLRVGLVVALVGLVGWDLFRFLLSLVRGVLTHG